MSLRGSSLFLLCAGLVTVFSCATGLTESEQDDDGTASSASAAGGSTGGGATASSQNSGGAASSATNSSSSSSSSSNASSNASTAASTAASSVASSSSSGMNCPLAPPTNLQGCPSCGAACDSPWPVSWTAVPGATHYLVEYTCFMVSSYQTSNTSVDLCNEVGMCNNSACAFGAGPVTVKACDSICCSAPGQVPLSETPIACGGGVCC